ITTRWGGRTNDERCTVIRGLSRSSFRASFGCDSSYYRCVALLGSGGRQHLEFLGDELLESLEHLLFQLTLQQLVKRLLAFCGVGPSVDDSIEQRSGWPSSRSGEQLRQQFPLDFRTDYVLEARANRSARHV